MTFFESVAKCYRKYLDFKGRAGKREFWWFVLLVFLFAWPLSMAELRSGTWYGIFSFIYFLLTLSTFIPFLAVWTRRLHDVGKSAWTMLFIFLPVVGWILLFRWAVKDGDSWSNQYGKQDNSPIILKNNGEEEALLEDANG